LSETGGPDGYTEDTTFSCSIDGGVAYETSTITLNEGESATCTINNTAMGMVTVHKISNGVEDPTKDIAFDLYNGPNKGDGSGFLGNPIATDTTLGDQDGILDFGGFKLVPGNVYTVCENPVPAGWTSFWYEDANNNGMYENGEVVITPYNPHTDDIPQEDVGVRCHDFSVEDGETLNLGVENDFPGGEPRTIGYWKNWNSCSGGGQFDNAEANGGAAEGFFVLDDVLPQTIGTFTIEDCDIAVNILDKREVDKRHKKRASDAAYGLAAQLLAAQANLTAGAVTCTEVQDAVVDANDLLTAIGFDGTGSYLGKVPKNDKDGIAEDKAEALRLATALDEYNNGLVCPLPLP
jgi:hypothetical protein